MKSLIMALTSLRSDQRAEADAQCVSESPEPEQSTPRDKGSVSLSISVSDDGERCSAQISVAGGPMQENEPSAPVSVDQEHPDVKHDVEDVLASIGVAIEGNEPNAHFSTARQLAEGEQEDASPGESHGKTYIVNETVSGHGSSHSSPIQLREVNTNSAVDTQVQSLTPHVSPRCDPGPGHAVQASVEDRYGGNSNWSTGNSSANEPAAAQSPCSVSMPQADQSPNRYGMLQILKHDVHLRFGKWFPSLQAQVPHCR